MRGRGIKDLAAGVIAAAVLSLACGKDNVSQIHYDLNTAPVADFTVRPDSGTTSTVFVLDAAGSSDAEDSVSVLEVRWDWEEDGTWDTDYAVAKTASHQYGTTGTKKIRLEVRDRGRLIATATREVAIGPAPLVAGEFIPVPAGTFSMGSPLDEPGRDPEETLHSVTLSRAVVVSRYEVTQAEWESVMGWDESSFDGPNRPVEQVTWFDAVAYCNACSHRDGYRSAYAIADIVTDSVHVTSAAVTWDPSADGYRLLTESEWEYVCRAGTGSAFGQGTITNLHCADPVMDGAGWYCGNTGSGTHDVGGKAANAWGLQDMHGNVWEWCWDWYAAAYPDTSETDPVGPAGPAPVPQRVIRGGSWDHEAGDCRSASRGVLNPGHRGSVVGVRLARTAP
jgi:formylglycine-generating enzyme required for sulfatase activity